MDACVYYYDNIRVYVYINSCTASCHHHDYYYYIWLFAIANFTVKFYWYSHGSSAWTLSTLMGCVGCQLLYVYFCVFSPTALALLFLYWRIWSIILKPNVHVSIKWHDLVFSCKNLLQNDIWTKNDIYEYQQSTYRLLSTPLMNREMPVQRSNRSRRKNAMCWLHQWPAT